MPLGISPLNDFAFKKSFGTIASKPQLMSFLNAILDDRPPIVDLTLQNPFSVQDFHDDKLSVLDLKVVDQASTIYNLEVQLALHDGLIQRLVYYGCESYAGQLLAGDDYSQLNPVVTICLLDGILWKDSTKVHHEFKLIDRESGRILPLAIEIHTLELGRYNLRESDLATAKPQDCWFYWLLRAQDYEAEELLKLFPQTEMQQATRSLISIAEITEDKTMYDAREKALRDYHWAVNSARREGLEEGKREGQVELIRTLEDLLGGPLTDQKDLKVMSFEQLQSLASNLQAKLRQR